MESGLGTEGSPAAAEFLCRNEAVAAIGIAREEKKEEELALRRVEVNSLAVKLVVRGLKTVGNFLNQKRRKFVRGSTVL